MAQVKRNQPSLHQAMEELLLNQLPIDEYQEEENNHGRHTLWQVAVYNARQCPKASEWKKLARFIHVHRICTDTKTSKQIHSDRFYITDLACTDASLLAKGIRGHWSIENRLHYVKDVIHNEDNNRIKKGNGPMNCSIISSFAINFHRKNGYDSISDGQVAAQANTENIICEFKT